jgi:hypothetical protein
MADARLSEGQVFFFSSPLSGPIQPPIQCVPWVLSSRVHRPGREIWNVLLFTSMSPISCNDMLFRYRDRFNFVLDVNGKGKGKKVKLSLCFLTKHHAMKAHWGVDVQLHSFFDLGTRWRWVVSFTPRLLYSQRKSSQYPLDGRLDGPKSCSGCGGGEKNSHPRRESNPRTPIVKPVAQSLYRMSYHGSPSKYVLSEINVF